MTKLSTKKLTENKIGLLIDQLWRAITLLETKEEVHDFLHDLLTRTELQMVAKRLQVVKMLSEGFTYLQIRKQYNISDVTIAKINNWFESFGKGYRLVIQRLQEIEKRKNIPQRSIVTGQIKAAQRLWIGAGKEALKLHKKYRKRRSAQI